MTEFGFAAPHASWCAFCGDKIEEGELVRWVTWMTWCHATCVVDE